MYISIVSVVFLVGFGLIVEGDALSCLPCNKNLCKRPNCKGGLVTDPCGCCYVCAKRKGEECGGPWNIFGKCDEGLICRKKEPLNINSTGTCVRRYYVRPGCRVRPYGRRHKGQRFCTMAFTKFCTANCRRCIWHNNGCNPNPSKYIPGYCCHKKTDLTE